MLLFATSFIYPQWTDSAQKSWSEEDAQEFVELSRQMHSMDSQFSAERRKDSKARPSDELARVADSYLQKEGQLREAQQAGQGVARILYYLGIGLVSVGGVCFLASRSGDD